METIAFVGPSGTGKSHQALDIARQNDVDAIIDDGLLIYQGKIIAGFSAKREAHSIQAVRRAIFTDDEHVEEVKAGLASIQPRRVMIIGTSERMVRMIAQALSIEEPVRIIYIHEVTSEADIQTAREMRMGEGKHVIPVPFIEMKRRFSGYVVDTIEHFFSGISGHKEDSSMERTIVRPRFSYMGKLVIAEKVFETVARLEAAALPGCARVNACEVRQSDDGVMYHLNLTLDYGVVIPDFAKVLIETISEATLRLTGNPVLQMEVTIKSILYER